KLVRGVGRKSLLLLIRGFELSVGLRPTAKGRLQPLDHPIERDRQLRELILTTNGQSARQVLLADLRGRLCNQAYGMQGAVGQEKAAEAGDQQRDGQQDEEQVRLTDPQTVELCERVRHLNGSNDPAVSSYRHGEHTNALPARMRDREPL